MSWKVINFHIKIAFGLIGENWGGGNLVKVWDETWREWMIIGENSKDSNGPSSKKILKKRKI